MVSGRGSPVCTPTGPAVLLFRGVAGQSNAYSRVTPVESANKSRRIIEALISGEVAEWQTRTVQVRVPVRA